MGEKGNKAYLINSIVIKLRATRNVLSADSVVHIRPNTTGSNSIDSDLLVTKVDGHASHKRLDGTLGARVNSVSGHTLGLAGDGSHKDQTATNLEVVVGLPSDKELATSVDVEDTVKLLGGDVLDVAKGDDTTVGADNVQVAPDLLGFGKHLDDLVNIGDVSLDGYGVGTTLLDGLHDLLGGLGAVGVVHNDFGTTTSQLEGHLTTDTTT